MQQVSVYSATTLKIKGIELAAERVVDIDPNHVCALYNLALAYWAAENKGRAIKAIRRVIEIYPSFKRVNDGDRQYSQFKKTSEIRNLMQ